MSKKRTKVVSTKWLPVEQLIVPPYYGELYPLPRDWSRLRESFERDGYKPEYPLTVRPSDVGGETFEIVCGVGRFTVARERGMRRVPAVVLELGDEEAVPYAVEDNLYAPVSSADLSLPQAIFLSRLLAGRGRKFPPRLIWEFAKVSESTFRRAAKGFDLAVGKAAREHPELEGLDLQGRVAEMLRRDLFPEFTRLWTGALEVNSFHEAHGRTLTGGRRATPKSSTRQTTGGEKNPAVVHGAPPREADRTTGCVVQLDPLVGGISRRPLATPPC